MALLEVKNLSKSFGEVKAVRNVSFNLTGGEIVALLGPNGAGKTTTLRCITGLLRPDQGDIRVAGHPAASSLAKARLAMVPETPSLYPLLTVWEHLRFVSLAYGGSDNFVPLAEELLTRFDLIKKKNHFPHTLSKGMIQKVVIACALIHQADIFLLDEPFIGLDPRATREFKDIILTAREQRKAILLSTHLLDVAEQLCDRVLLLHKGQLITTGTLKELREEAGAYKTGSLEDVFLTLTAEQRDE